MVFEYRKDHADPILFRVFSLAFSTQPATCLGSHRVMRATILPGLNSFHLLATRNSARAFGYTSCGLRDWLLTKKSGIAEAPLNLTWNIYASSGVLDYSNYSK